MTVEFMDLATNSSHTVSLRGGFVVISSFVAIFSGGSNHIYIPISLGG
jgi:hypothetical protein